MAIELENTFAVPVPPDQAWNVLLDVARVAPCMPGATVDEVDGDVVTGKIKVKVGPIALTYTGKATFIERDPAAHSVRVEAAGKETRGSGTASATVKATLEEENGQTRVRVHTSLNVTGRPAQFGRGVMADVSGRLIDKFSANLAEQLASGGSTASAASAADDAAAAAAPAAPPDARLSIPIQELNLPPRSYNTLKGAGIDTVGELVARTEDELLAIKNIGERSVQEIEEKLGEVGLGLAEAQPEHATAASNGSAPGITHTGTAHTSTTGSGPEVTGAPPPGQEDSDDALDLLDVAAVPILKRVLPAAGVVAVLVWLGIRLRGHQRRSAG
jgi:carbon monoxide dehydrogenase subunit G